MEYLIRISLIVLIWASFNKLAIGKYRKGRDVNQSNAIELIEDLLSRSDNRVRPNIYGDPVHVYCDFYIQGLGPINEVDMEFSMEIYFRQRWRDTRMNFLDIVTRLNLRLACNMLLLHFPLDYQDCSIKISSYSYDESNVRLSWLNNDPVEFDKERLLLPQFELLNVSPGKCLEQLTTGDFSCLEATFHLKRQVGFYVLQTYVPSILIVMLSWVSFWISKDAVPARITLGVTTILTMTTQLSTSRSNQMRVSYPKALDVWYALCMLFVFSALLEFAIVNILSRHEERRPPVPPKPDRPESETDTGTTAGDAEEESLKPPDSSTNGTTRRRRFNQTIVQFRGRVEQYSTIHMKGLTAKGIDKASRIIFPASFVLFNFVYWIVYTQPVVFNVFH